MKFLISTTEVHRVDTENEAVMLIEDAKKDGNFILTKYSTEHKEKKAKALKAFEKSYKKTSEELEELMNKLKISVTSQWGHRFVEDNIENILMLYLSLDSNTLNNLGAINSDARISSFVNNYLLFDENLKPGIVPLFSDHLFICSGVHV